MSIRNKIADIFNRKTFSGLLMIGSDTYDYTWRKEKALEYYKKSLYVNKAINKRAEKLGQIEFILLNKRGDVIENEWSKLLSKPNKYQTGDQFWSLVQKHLDIAGAAYILMERGEFSQKVKQLKLLDVHTTETVLTADRKDISHFRTVDGTSSMRYEPENIIYLYRPAADNSLLPESLIYSATRSIETELQISEYHTNVIKNGGKIESIFKIKSGARTQEQLDEIEKRYTEKYASAKNAGRPLFMFGDMEREEVGLKPSELSYLDTKTMSLNDICIATGVPKVLLGVGSGETYANADAEMRTFYTDTIKPAMEFLVDVLNWRLIPDEFELTFIDPTPQDIEKKLAVLKTAHDIFSLTINEKRQALAELGLEVDDRPEKEADSIFMPFNLMEVGEKGKPEKSEKMYHPLRKYENRRKHEIKMKRILDDEERLFEKEFNLYLSEQKKRVLGSIDKSKAITDFDITLEAKIGKERLLPVLKDIMIRTGQSVAVDYAVGIPFEMTPAIMKWLDKRTDIFTKQINETTFNELKNQFKESVSLNEPRKDLVRRIEDTYSNISQSRANTIARTEVHNALQKANYEAQGQVGMEIKIWVCSFQNSRPGHIEADGQERKINEPFIVGGEEMMYPGDGSPENSINCACTV